MRFESIIFENLIYSEDYFRKVLPHLKEEYFDTPHERVIFKFIQAFSAKHNKAPTKRILDLLVDEYDKFDGNSYKEAKDLVASLTGVEENQAWLIEKTETFCRDKAVYNAMRDAIQVLDGKNDQFNRAAIPSLLQDALAVSFDKSIGHNFFDDAEDRFEFYHKKEDRIPFRLSYFNKITRGGLPRKTLCAILAGVNCVHPDTKVKIRVRKNNK